MSDVAKKGLLGRGDGRSGFRPPAEEPVEANEKIIELSRPVASRTIAKTSPLDSSKPQQDQHADPTKTLVQDFRVLSQQLDRRLQRIESWAISEMSHRREPPASVRIAKAPGFIASRRALKAIRRSELFDQTYYRTQCVDVRDDSIVADEHFVREGAFANLDPHPLFSVEYYHHRYPKVKASGYNPLQHFALFGGQEEFDPHPLFDTGYYLWSSPDVKETRTNPLWHYMKYGAKEGRSPHRLFDPKFYLSQLPSQEASRCENPLVHFLTIGHRKGLKPHRLFDTAYYCKKNPDILTTHSNPLVHYVWIGAFEGRKPNPVFDTKWYTKHNPDLGKFNFHPLHHYMMLGEREGRCPSNFFDPRYYREREQLGPDESPLEHFLYKGALEGRNPSRYVNFSNYVRTSNWETAAEIVEDFFDRVVISEPLEIISPHIAVAREDDVPEMEYRSHLQKRNLAVPNLEVEKPIIPSTFGVSYYAPLRIVSGLGQACRGLLGAIEEGGIFCNKVPLPGPKYQASVEVSRSYTRKDWPVAVVYANADGIQYFFGGEHGSDVLRTPYRIGHWVWELPSFPQEWFVNTGPFDELWVPSKFCARAIGAVTDTPLHVIPHVVDLAAPSIERAKARAELKAIDLDSQRYTFLYSFDASSYVERKNPECLIEAFLQTFSIREPVALALKVTYAERSPKLARLLSKLEHDPRIRIIREVLDDAELSLLTDACDCYVSPHRSEGFGLTVAEAMLRGKPVIATNYGAVSEFLDETVGFPAAYRLVELGKDIGPYGATGMWAEPSVDDFARLLRYVVSNKTDAEQRGGRARELVQARFSRAAVGKLVRARIEAAYRALREG